MLNSAADLLKKLQTGDRTISQRIEEVYGDDRSERSVQFERLRLLLQCHAEEHGASSPVQVFRAPGRVNLIGEHTDYNGLPVMPVAIGRDILCAASPRQDGQMVVQNVNTRCGAFECPVASVPRPFEMGHWGNYVKAALQGLFDDGREYGVHADKFTGCSFLIEGNVPSAAGLSSSSALVVVSALALLGVHGCEIPKPNLAQILARAEHFVGTQGGGMDQTISLLGQRDHALKIDFNPFGYEPVPVPANVRIVVSNSLVKAAKTGDARAAYNRRVVECRTAAALLDKAVRERISPETQIRLLGDFTPQRTGVSESDLDRIAEDTIPKTPLSISEAAKRLSVSESEYQKRCCTLRSGEILQPPSEGFQVWKRYAHVVSEGRRVESAMQALKAGDLEQVGRLMLESHASCRDLYEISCDALDFLVSLAQSSGALGARLTGAGFGGCTVSLVRAEQVEAFISTIHREYYEGYLQKNHPDICKYMPRVDSCLFAVRPAEGAGRIL